MFKVLGKASYSGEYQGYKYNKVRLVCECAPNSKWTGVDGICAEVINVPSTDRTRAVKVGDKIDVRYNRYGKIEDIEILNERS